jgi:hypothetical protein
MDYHINNDCVKTVTYCKQCNLPIYTNVESIDHHVCVDALKKAVLEARDRNIALRTNYGIQSNNEERKASSEILKNLEDYNKHDLIENPQVQIKPSILKIDKN